MSLWFTDNIYLLILSIEAVKVITIDIAWDKKRLAKVNRKFCSFNSLHTMAFEGAYVANGNNNKKFRDGGSIPILGFGTGTDFHNRDNDASKSMIVAFNSGYRLFDTAQVCYFMITAYL